MGKTILVSAGHSTVPPVDPGAVGNGHREADLTLELRDLVVALLRAAGVKPLVDGEDGRNEPLTKAVALARQADVAVEIHFNAGPPSARGTEVLAFEDERGAAASLAAAVASAAGLSVRGSDGGWKRTDSGQHKSLAFCDAGGMILEVAFISSAADVAAYEAAKPAVARAIADVLVRLADRAAPLAPRDASLVTSARKRIGRPPRPLTRRTS